MRRIEGSKEHCDSFIDVLDIASGVVTRPRERIDYTRSFALSPDGLQFALGDADWTVELVDVDSGKTHRQFRVHSGEVHSVAFSPNGRHLATQGRWPDTTIRVWDLASDEMPLFLPTPWYGSMGIAFSANGSRVACEHGFEGVALYDAKSGLPIKQTLDQRSACLDDLDPQQWPKAFRHHYCGPDAESDHVSNCEAAIPTATGEQETSVATTGSMAWLPIRLQYAVPSPSGTAWAGAFENYLCLFAIENR